MNNKEIELIVKSIRRELGEEQGAEKSKDLLLSQEMESIKQGAMREIHMEQSIKKEIVNNISCAYSTNTSKAEQLFLNVINSMSIVKKDNFCLRFYFKNLGNTITISKTNTPKKEKQRVVSQEVTESVESIYDLPPGIIGTNEASRTTGVNRRRIQYLIDSGKVESKKVRYRDQVRVLIVKDSLYKIHPRIK